MTEFNKIAVGQPFTGDARTLQEGAHFNFAKGSYNLILVYNSPTKEEIHAVKKGKAEFSFLLENNIIFFLHKFKPLLWGDSPYSYCIVPKDQQVPPIDITEIEGGTGIGLEIILVDGKTDIVKAIRFIGLENSLSRRLNMAINYQIDNPISLYEYNQQINAAYRKYPSTLNMVSSSYEN